MCTSGRWWLIVQDYVQIICWFCWFCFVHLLLELIECRTELLVNDWESAVAFYYGVAKRKPPWLTSRPAYCQIHINTAIALSIRIAYARQVDLMQHMPNTVHSLCQ